MSKQKAWNVYSREGEWMERVFFNADMTGDDVRHSLVNCSDYPPDIEVCDPDAIKLVCVVEGGILTGVRTNTKLPIEVEVIDLDNVEEGGVDLEWLQRLEDETPHIIY